MTITLIILVLLLIAVLIFTVAANVIFEFDSLKEDMSLAIIWIYPFLKAVVTKKDQSPYVTVYLFNKSIFSKQLNTGKKPKYDLKRLASIVKPFDVRLNTGYSLGDPFMTGVACGAINMASQFINIDSIEQNPDFTSVNDYICVDATAKVNIGRAIVNFIKQ